MSYANSAKRTASNQREYVLEHAIEPVDEPVNEPVLVTNVSSNEFEKYHLRFSDILNGLELVTHNSDNSISYGNMKQDVSVSTPPFYIGYHTPDTICFTRISNDSLELIRKHDVLSMKGDMLYHTDYNRRFADADMRVLIHYPGQLLRSFEKHSLFNNFKTLGDLTGYHIDFEISGVTVLKKRPDSNNPCNADLEDDDLKLQTEIMKLVGCVPIYWKNIVTHDLGLSDCKTSEQLAKIYYHTRNYQDFFISYVPPCVTMNAIVMRHREKDSSGDELFMKFWYRDKHYQEIQNTKNFNFESFWSGIGGFVGIFLGYSMLQLVDVAENIPSFLRKVQSRFSTDKTLGNKKRKWLSFK